MVVNNWHNTFVSLTKFTIVIYPIASSCVWELENLAGSLPLDDFSCFDELENSSGFPMKILSFSGELNPSTYSLPLGWGLE